jgi:hypothetical protein
MLVAGIDYSSRFVDVVTVPYEGAGAPVWHRFPLVGADAFDRARSVADSVPGRSSVLWEDIIAVGIEHPGGNHGTGALVRVQGAVLARIPARMLVHPLPPGRWRKLVGLPGNASKGDVALYACDPLGHFDYRRHPDGEMKVPDLQWEQDAYDAYCIALATRSLIDTKQAA